MLYAKAQVESSIADMFRCERFLETSLGARSTLGAVGHKRQNETANIGLTPSDMADTGGI